jgi:hypothetical protein
VDLSLRTFFKPNNFIEKMIKTPRTSKPKIGSSRNIRHHLGELLGKKRDSAISQKNIFLSPKETSHTRE